MIYLCFSMLQHPEEEEAMPVTITGVNEAEPETKQLLSLDEKKGGATQV